MRKSSRNITQLRPRYDPTANARQRRWREKQKKIAAVAGKAPHNAPTNVTDTLSITPAPAPPADPTPTSEPRSVMATPLAVVAVTEALSNLVDTIEFVRPDQLVRELNGVDLDGAAGDARLAAEWLIGLLEALS